MCVRACACARALAAGTRRHDRAHARATSPPGSAARRCASNRFTAGAEKQEARKDARKRRRGSDQSTSLCVPRGGDSQGRSRAILRRAHVGGGARWTTSYTRARARAHTHTHTHDRCRWRFCWTTSCRRRRRWSGSSRSGSTRTRPAQTRCPPPGIRPHTRGAPATARPSTQTHPFPPWHRELLSSARPPPNALSTLVLRELVHLGGGGGRGDGGRCRTRWTR